MDDNKKSPKNPIETEPAENEQSLDELQASDNTPSSQDKDWLAELLSEAENTELLGTDEQAVLLAGLTKPEDVALEKILAEDWSSIPTPEELEMLEATETAETSQPLPEEPQAQDASLTEDATTVFQKVAPDDVPEDLPPQAEEPVSQKLRPKKKNGYGLLGIPHILSTAVWLVLIVAIGVSLGRLLWVCCADVMAFGKEPQKVTITITEEDTIDSIAKKLGQANLVRYPGLFKLFAQITGKDENISAGTFTLYSHLDYNAMINAMVDWGEAREVVSIMFPEGANCAQIFKLLEEKNVCTVAELEEYAANGELSDYWFLEGVPRGNKYCLEGYMSPDTYKFYTNDEPRRVIEKFLNEFEDRFTDKMKADFETIRDAFTAKLTAKGFSAAYIEENTLTLHKIVTLASIIQKETSSDAESYDISSVFYNRLANHDIMNLGADATVYYALGDYFWEINELTEEHLNVDSPYNTRKYKGIPPGPICNMGAHALYATLEPNETDYHYFVYDSKAGSHRFAVTYKEHIDNIADLED